MSGGVSSGTGIGTGAGVSGGGGVPPNPPPPGGPGIPPAAGGGGGINPADGAVPPDYTKTAEFALWVEYEKVAMHFNELTVRLRTQALGGLAGVVAISGFAVNFSQKSGSDAQWLIFFGSLLFFAFAWLAIWILDIKYYNKLLVGAVTAILDHEKKSKERSPDWPIELSTEIHDAIPMHEVPIRSFYLLVLSPLILGVFYTGYEAFFRPPAGNPDPLEYKIQLNTPDVLKIAPDPAKIDHKVELSVPSPVKVAPEPARVDQKIEVKIPDGVKVISEPAKSN
ncbi:MAG TPA: hypothetical protein VGI40_21110 [Pirellulaceae bacterium]|jgi:hypothetical protein